jgi:hypothetical protein
VDLLGYEVTATEFVKLEHAMKNRLLTCIRRGSELEEAQKQFETLKASLGGLSLTLEACEHESRLTS